MSLLQDCINDRRFLVRCLIVSCFVLLLTTVWTLDNKLIKLHKFKADGKSKLLDIMYHVSTTTVSSTLTVITGTFICCICIHVFQ